MENRKRPLLLESLCLLSFIGNTIGFTAYLMAAIFYKKVSLWIISVTNLTAMEGITPVYFLLFAVLFLVSFTGVLMMWKLSATGLLFYIPAQIILLFLPVIRLGWQAFSMVNAVFSLLFIVLYLSQSVKLKWKPADR